MARSAAACSSQRQAGFRAQRKGILFFLKRFGFFPFVRSEHNPTSTKNMTTLHSRKSLAAFVTATLVGVVLLVRPALATEPIQVERHHLVDNIYEYSYVISTG